MESHSTLGEEERNRKTEAHRVWVNNNRDHVREYDRKHRERNIELEREKKRKRYAANPEYFREQQRKYRENNKDKVAVSLFKSNNKPKRRYEQYKANAAKKKIEFDITFEQFMEYWCKPCCYCGSGIDTIGLDRVDSDIGYIIGNIVPCCATCNYMKRTMTEQVFIGHCRKILAFHSHTSECS